jgi:CheY-like chemotaxis protein
VAIRKPKGCSSCGFTGYRGRVAIEEILTVDGTIAELIAQGALGEALLSSGRRYGMRTLWEAGLRRVWTGETGFDEIVRVVGEPVAEPGAAPAVAPPAPLEPVAAAQAAPPTGAAEPVVLVADDDPAIRSLYVAVLSSGKFHVVQAQDGMEALELAQRLHPDILLLDMDMPRLNGFGVLEQLRQRLSGRSVPVIVVTARDDPATETRCIEMGAEDYVTKPIQPPTLLARVRAVLRRVGAKA